MDPGVFLMAEMVGCRPRCGGACIAVDPVDKYPSKTSSFLHQTAILGYGSQCLVMPPYVLTCFKYRAYQFLGWFQHASAVAMGEV